MPTDLDPSIPLERLLFEAAAGFSTHEERRRFLDHTTAGDPDLRARLETLLAVQEEADSFFEFRPHEGATRAESLEATDLDIGVGRYRLIERLGEGGCGVVYRAEQLEPVNREVAIKILRVGLESPEGRARLRAESQALASLAHPHIARILDADSFPDGRPYLVMECVHGTALTEFCRLHHLPLQSRLELFVKICRALQHAHQRGVVHRDLKPSNLLVELHDSVAVPRVIDFGLALELDSRPSDGRDLFLGTPSYMSPEQASESPLHDTRSDLFSLGVILSELIAGPPRHLPESLGNQDIKTIRLAIQQARAWLPSKTLAHLTPEQRADWANLLGLKESTLIAACHHELDWLVAKATQHDPSLRYESASDLASDVQRWLDHEPVRARPHSQRYRWRKLIRKHRVGFSAGALALAGLIAGLGVATVLFFREKSARSLAERALASEAQLRQRAEIRSRVAEAAVRVHYHDWTEASRWLSGIPVEQTPPSLEAVHTNRAVAEWHLRAGRQQQADERFLAMAVALARVDPTDTETVSMDLLPGATAVCRSGDLQRYDWFRHITLQRFADTHQPVVAEQVLKGSLLRPANSDLLDRLQPLAMRVQNALENHQSRTWRDPDLRAWSCFALELLRFRMGQDEDARNWAELCLQQPPVNPTCPISARIVLSMIARNQGRNEEFELLLAEAAQEAQGHLDDIRELGGTQSGFWFDWVNVQLLLEEARTHR
ncbi:hypothetical protein HNR46_000279 [Haloferula luteola]|uniref:Protein kinase domain-containing protein n=1 Tax=Haloferula luteola TaxID=595692 RepID=A0A840V5J3_9BACT|nr:serine/threonine-protein kinase [Haloferula luteola]MBB5350058.1 hypothetical protein [Haloferula luteola]